MPKDNVPPPPAMTITIDVDAGPTVRLAYDGRRVGAPLVARTRITIGEQPTPFGPDDLYDLLVQACAVVFDYASAHNDWPPELRPAPQTTHLPQDAEEEVSYGQ
jgi:hypothetical protein